MTSTHDTSHDARRAGSGRPLDDVLVVDLSRALAGPHATMMLGDLGARVIKVETPDGGDDTRGWGPPFVGEEGGRQSTYFLSANRNKESIALDLKDEADRDVLLRLVDRADVLVENFRTGVLERLGLAVESLQERNPRLVVLSITGFGHDGPEGGRAGYDQIAQGEAGLMSLTGSGPDDPQRVGTPIADLLAGMYGAYGVLAAINERHRTGRGSVVRTSLLASVVGVHAFQGTRWTVAGEVGRAQGNHHPSISPYGLFRCRDGAVQIALGSEGLWRRFCAGFGLDPAAEGLATNPERVAVRDRVVELVEQVFADWDGEALLARLAEVGVPAGKVRSMDEVYAWDQTRSQGLLIDVEHATLGTVTLPGPPLRFFDADGSEVTRRDHDAPPVLDEDGERAARLAAGAVVTGRWRVAQLLDLVLDDRSFESWDRPIDISGHTAEYRATLEAATAKAGTDESVITGRGLVRGRPVAVVANEFAFLAGSIGSAAAERITAAVRRATAEGLPVLATTASGGTRMQEGTPAFVQMVEISRAVMDHRAAGLPYLVYLRDPTMGGVFASWGSLAHITVAEPGALLGFLGPKVYEAMNSVPFPSGVQTSENLAARGVIDAVVEPELLPSLVDHALAVLVDSSTEPVLPRRGGEPDDSASAWSAIERTRSTGRAGVRDLLRVGGSSTVRLRGTDEGERDATMIVALTRLDGQACVLVGQDRTRQSLETPMGPAALREARRAMRLAEELGLPLVTVIDTPGAELSQRAEEGSIAGEIARCIATMTTMSVPTLSVVLGQGCGGGALALLPARVVVAAESAWLAPLPPEGASAIVHRGDTSHAPELAEHQQVRAVDLLRAGTVQHVVPEVDGESADDLAAAVVAECSALLWEMSPRR